jgi:hypothetical protein
MELLRHALQRDTAKRFASASDMGAQCEHILYDKGYGPTNLTLKHKLGELFPEAPSLAMDSEPTPFPLVDATLLPIDDGTPPSRRTGDTTQIASTPTTDDGVRTRAAGLPERVRRVKPRQRPRS